MASLFAAAKRFVSYVTGAADEEVETEAEKGRRTGGANPPSSSSQARRRERSSGGSGGSGGGGAEGAARAKRAHLDQQRLQPLLVDAPLGTGGVQGSRGLERAQRAE